MNKNTRGQILPMVMICLVILALIISGLVSWVQTDAKWSVKESKANSAVNIAEAGIDRGTWKLQSSTTAWNQAASGVPMPGGGYAFDKTFTDIPGGTYRIKFASTTSNGQPAVTVTSEGRDNSTNEVRAVSALYRNQTIYSPLMAGGMVTWAAGLVIFWGPIMSQGNIKLMDNTVAGIYYPRKFAKGVVFTDPAVNPIYQRDTNGLLPPNTDNVEWWSEYSGVPNVPVLDFTALKSSAVATGTYNVYGCRSTQGGPGVNNSATAWDIRTTCGGPGSHATHFGNPWCHPKSARNQPNTDYVWYWDGDVTLTGGSNTNESCGLRGTLIVMGNLTIATPGEYTYSGHVPAEAWKEHQKLLIGTNDTNASGEYPGDIGLHVSTGIFHFGTDSFNVPGLGGGPYTNTIGMRGFTYVGNSLYIVSYMDFNGAVWVNGSVSATGGSMLNSCGIFYNDNLVVPALNVVLLRVSWQEVPASSIAWP